MCGKKLWNFPIMHSAEISWFSITQILREIKIGDFRSAKSAIFTHLEALNLDIYDFFHFFKAEIDQIKKFQSHQNVKKDSFSILRNLNIDFT